MFKQLIISVSALKISKDFIVKHKLWEGWRSMAWLHTLFTLSAVFFCFKMVIGLGDTFANLGHILTGDFNKVQHGFAGFLPGLPSGVYKYLFLFFTMSLVFHISGKAMEILYRVPYQPSFKLFFQSQIRAAVFLLVSFILEQALAGISSLVLGLAHLKWLQPVAQFIIQSFLFGAILMDGLHITYGKGIKQSLKQTFYFYPGIAILFGSIGIIMSYIPLVGVFMVGSVVTVGLMIATKRLDLVRQS